MSDSKGRRPGSPEIDASASISEMTLVLSPFLKLQSYDNSFQKQN